MLSVLDVAGVWEEAVDGAHMWASEQGLAELVSALAEEAPRQHLHLLPASGPARPGEAPIAALKITRHETGPVCLGWDGQRLLAEGGADGFAALAEAILHYLHDTPVLMQPGQPVQYFGLLLEPHQHPGLLTAYSMPLRLTRLEEPEER